MATTCYNRKQFASLNTILGIEHNESRKKEMALAVKYISRELLLKSNSSYTKFYMIN